MKAKPHEDSPDQDFEISGTVLTKYLGSESRVYIPMYIQGSLITVIGEDAFAHCTGVDYVECSLTTKEIRPRAFAHASLRTVKMQHGTKKIGRGAFAHCKRLLNVSLPNDLQVLEEEVFRGCENLTALMIPSTVQSVGEHCFLGCHSLVYLKLPETMTSLPEGCFCGCSSLVGLSLPSMLRYLGKEVFASCGLQELSLPQSLQYIGEGAFRGCASLEQVNLPFSLVKVESEAFQGCCSLQLDFLPPTGLDLPWALFADSAMTEGEFHQIKQWSLDSLPRISSHKGGYIQGSGMLLSYEEGLAELEVPPYLQGGLLRGIASQLFRGQNSLRLVDLPYTVKVLEAFVFYQCKGLEELRFPPLCQEIPAFACGECDSLKRIVFPQELRTVGTASFSHCVSLESIQIPEGTVRIEAYAFSHCVGLKRVYLPSTLEYIGEGAFEGCNDGASVSIYGKLGSMVEQYAKGAGMVFCPVLGNVLEI